LCSLGLGLETPPVDRKETDTKIRLDYLRRHYL
jgi:hypothetical protein